jgi:Ca-activated chloride channel family protein
MLTKKLRAQDRISLVVYAGRTQVELEPTPGDQQDKILAAIDRLEATGSTAGESAMKLAYQMARSSYIPNGINRILMATDGDFNVGLSNIDQLKDMVAAERKTGISLTTLGFGQGNYNDYLMEQVADAGNGNYSYIDSADEGRKVLIEEMTSTFNTVAADVKVQIEFNPAQIAEYRLIGYENKILNEEDFNNDKVDAGEIGAGKTVTALYELTPVNKATLIDPHRYDSTSANKTTPTNNNELAFLRIRYKQPNADKSILMEEPVLASNAKTSLEKASDDFRFAASVAGFGQMLRDSNYVDKYDFDKLIALAKSGLGDDEGGYRGEFIRLIKVAQDLSPQKPKLLAPGK